MPDGDGNRIVVCETERLELKSNKATIVLGITDDEGLLRKIVDSLDKFSTDALRAMLDSKPIGNRLDLIVRDKRNGTSEELTEEQKKYYVGVTIEERERAEDASTKQKKPLWLKIMQGAVWPVVLALIIAAAVKLSGLA